MPCDTRLVLPARPRPPPCRALRFDRATIGTPSVVSRSTSLSTGFLAMLAYVVRKRCMTRAPFSPWSRRRVRQHVERYPPWPAPRCRLALRLAVPRDARCVGPTSAILTSTYEYPRLVGSRCVATLSRLAQPRNHGLPVSTTVQFASAGRTLFPSNFHRGGRCLPVAMRANRASDIPVASLAFPVTLARSRVP
jgi:hypothetical protein